MITAQQIKELRDETGLSIAQVKSALEEASGDKTNALAILKEKGAEIAKKKADRDLGSGVIASYIHAGDGVGAMIELLCETDFVAKNPEFKFMAREIAMHIAAMNPADAGELLAQPFIKDGDKTIGELVNGIIQKFGERTEIGEFKRLSIN